MAKATFVKKAQKNIYEHGKEINYKSKKGKNKGKMFTKLDRTIPENKKDKVFIAKGESYYWWAFQYRPKQYSKTAPRRSQLTQSDFLSQLYDLEDRLESCSVANKDDFDSFKEELMSEIETLKDECQEKLDNMPEQLQSAPSGEILQERIDALENWHSEIESIECDVDEEQIAEEVRGENEQEEDEDEKMDEEEVQEEINRRIEENIQESIAELENTSSGL